VRSWHSGRAALCGALVGAMAAAFKMFGPWAEANTASASIREIAVASLGFALLFAGAAVLRNLTARRLIGRHDG
jgi:Na+-transporting NADH:ubiquinone oxidoreductase subunit NqrB